jgi:hypothetical protein
VAEAEDGERHRLLVEIRRSSLDDVDVRDARVTNEPTGTVVVLSDFDSPPPGLGGSTVADNLTGEFALHLTRYPVEITYDGLPIDPRALQASTASYQLASPDVHDAHLDIVEWSKPMDRRLFLCTENGIALSEMQPGVQAAGFDFTAYVRWDGFAADAALDLAELNAGPTADVVEAGREKLREHFRERAADRRREVIEAWQRDNVYPYDATPSSKVERTSRELFDVVAFTARDAVGADARTQRFTLACCGKPLSAIRGTCAASLRRFSNSTPFAWRTSISYSTERRSPRLSRPRAPSPTAWISCARSRRSSTSRKSKGGCLRDPNSTACWRLRRGSSARSTTC